MIAASALTTCQASRVQSFFVRGADHGGCLTACNDVASDNVDLPGLLPPQEGNPVSMNRFWQNLYTVAVKLVVQMSQDTNQVGGYLNTWRRCESEDTLSQDRFHAPNKSPHNNEKSARFVHGVWRRRQM